jgi:broad specificity phosphatase PhoE
MKIGEFFKFESLKNNGIDVIYCSPALRCFKTAELIFQYCENQEIDVYCDDRLYSFDSIKNKLKLKTDLNNFISDVLTKHHGKNVLIITHNHCIDILHKIYVENLHDDEYVNSEYSSYKVDNCAISCINFVNPTTYDIQFWNRMLSTHYNLID